MTSLLQMRLSCNFCLQKSNLFKLAFTGGSRCMFCMRLDLPYAGEQEAVAFGSDMQRVLHTVSLVLSSVRGPCCARRVLELGNHMPQHMR